MTTSTWLEMKQQKPRLGELERRARQAGSEGRPWSRVWRELVKELLEVIGFRTKDFQMGHRGLLWAWGGFDKPQEPFPWELREGLFGAPELVAWESPPGDEYSGASAQRIKYPQAGVVALGKSRIRPGNGTRGGTKTTGFYRQQRRLTAENPNPKREQ